MKANWKPASEAPKDGTKILVRTSMGFEIAHWYEIPQIRYEHVEGDLYRRIEHPGYGGWDSNYFELWTELPELPPEPTHLPKDDEE